MSLSGHFWTIAQYLRGLLAAGLPATLQPFTHSYSSAGGRLVTLTGALLDAPSDELLVVLHGLGGSIDSRYMPSALAAASRAGIACLLLNARGAGDSPGAIAHAGLTEDVASAIGSQTLTRYRSLYLFGYSMGGHVALRHGSQDPDPRLKGIAAVCSPLDLYASMRAFDQPRFSVYRRHVLGSLIVGFRRWAAIAEPSVSLAQLERVQRIQRIFDWDELVVAPAFGFESALDYYRRESAAETLGHLRVPALYVGVPGDPMVPFSTVETALSEHADHVECHWCERGGHLAFPRDFTLEPSARPGLEDQCLAWLRKQP